MGTLKGGGGEGRSAAVNGIFLRCPGFAADNEDFSCMKKTGIWIVINTS